MGGPALWMNVRLLGRVTDRQTDRTSWPRARSLEWAGARRGWARIYSRSRLTPEPKPGGMPGIDQNKRKQERDTCTCFIRILQNHTTNQVITDLPGYKADYNSSATTQSVLHTHTMTNTLPEASRHTDRDRHTHTRLKRVHMLYVWFGMVHVL